MSALTALLACRGPESTGEVVAPWLPPVDHPVWFEERVPGLANAWHFGGLLPVEEVARLTCTLDDDPTEVHTAESTFGRLVDVTMYGLLADADYSCVLAAFGEEERVGVHTDALPGWLPRWELTVPGGIGGAYTLLNHGTSDRGDRETKLLLVDAEGRLRWYYDVPFEAPDLDAQYLGDGVILYGGGYNAPPTRIDLSGEVLEQADPALPWHHHVEQLGDGEVIAIRKAPDEGPDDSWRGFVIERLGEKLKQVQWSWDSQRGVDDGWLPAQVEPNDEDPYHANALVWTDDAVVVNLYELGWIAKIDRSSGRRVWTLGPGRDFRLFDADGVGLPDSEWFWHTHAPELDGDRLLVYDNGRDRPVDEPFSRALELELDVEAGRATIVWEFREPGWYETIWGDVDRLPSGNVLVLRAHCRHCTTFVDQRTEVLEVDPATNEVVWRLTFLDDNDASYRAARIEGCDIFANAKYCY